MAGLHIEKKIKRTCIADNAYLRSFAYAVVQSSTAVNVNLSILYSRSERKSCFGFFPMLRYAQVKTLCQFIELTVLAWRPQ
jgi:hypothetical protein